MDLVFIPHIDSDPLETLVFAIVAILCLLANFIMVGAVHRLLRKWIDVNSVTEWGGKIGSYLCLSGSYPISFFLGIVVGSSGGAYGEIIFRNIGLEGVGVFLGIVIGIVIVTAIPCLIMSLCGLFIGSLCGRAFMKIENFINRGRNPSLSSNDDVL